MKRKGIGGRRDKVFIDLCIKISWPRLLGFLVKKVLESMRTWSKRLEASPRFPSRPEGTSSYFDPFTRLCEIPKTLEIAPAPLLPSLPVLFTIDVVDASFSFVTIHRPKEGLSSKQRHASPTIEQHSRTVERCNNSLSKRFIASQCSDGWVSTLLGSLTPCV